MTTKHLLPCQCGRNIVVDPRQAGESVRCECGRSVDVPTLRQLRRLDPVKETDGRDKTRTPWSTGQGVVFAIGSLIALIGFVAAILLFIHRSRLDTARPPAPDLERLREDTRRASADHLWEFWWKLSAIKEQRLKRRTPRFILDRRRAKTLSTYMYFAAGAGTVGVGVATVAMFIRPKQRRKRRKRPGTTRSGQRPA